MIVRKIALWIALAAFWVPVFLIHPALTYSDGTARNITVVAVVEPYVDSPVLTYRWQGEIYRSCEISLRRSVVDSLGHVTTLIDTPVLPPLPRDHLGETSVLLEANVGANLPEGPAQYRVVEVPRCSWLQRLWPVAIEYPPVNFNVRRS